MVTAGLTTVGYFTKKLDYDRGKELRCCNSFAAGFSMFLFLACTEWLFFNLSQGSFWELHKVLCSNPKKTIGPDDVVAGDRLCVYIFAYMFQDVVQRVLANDVDFRYMCHHIACMIGLILVLVFGQSPLHCIAMCVSEFSTPVVCLIEVAQTEGKNVKKFLEPCGILLNLLFPLRIMWFSYTFYCWICVYRTESLLALTLDNIGYVLTFFLLVINWSWWLQLVWATAKMLIEQNNTKAKEL